MIRLRAGISYALTETMDEGYCGLPTDQLIPLAEELLEAPRELILTALELERSDGADGRARAVHGPSQSKGPVSYPLWRSQSFFLIASPLFRKKTRR